MMAIKTDNSMMCQSPLPALRPSQDQHAENQNTDREVQLFEILNVPSGILDDVSLHTATEESIHESPKE